MTVGEEWTIEEPGLVIGINRLTVTARSFEGKEYSAETCILNLSMENMEASQVDLSDRDGDGLNHYFETILGTDPESEDSDSDVLKDMDELIGIGTDPLNSDTDADGTLDGEEDPDGDGLSNREEIQAGTEPLFSDTDGDGILDGEEVTLQTFHREIEETHRSGVTEIEVVMECAGHIDNEISVLDTYDIDMRSTELAGLVGVPVDISCCQEFDHATLIFHYEEGALPGEEENLGILWYDEENDNYILVADTILDKEGNTISCTTDHFSTWLVVDKEQWKKCFAASVSATESAGNGYPALTLELEDGVHRYQLFENHGSYTDAEEICRLAGGYLATIQSSVEDAAVYNYIRTQKCESAYIGLSDAAEEGKWEWSNGEEVAYTNWHYGEPNGLTRENYAMYYYKFPDGSWNDGAFNSGFTVQDVSIFICEWKDVDTETDSDGDGLPDYYERNGMRLSNGTLLYTDPFKTDTDGDGISDYDEAGGLPVWEEYVMDGKTYRALVHHPASYHKLSSEFIYVDGRLNGNGIVENGRMEYVPYSDEFKKELYNQDQQYRPQVFEKTKTTYGIAGVHGLYSDKTGEIAAEQWANYMGWNAMIIQVLVAQKCFMANECFTAYITGIGGSELGIDNMGTRKYVDANQIIQDTMLNSANEHFKENMCKAMKVAEEVLSEQNREVYIALSPETVWTGCQYHHTNGLWDDDKSFWENVGTNYGTLIHMDEFGTYNKADAGVTLHCTYDPKTKEYRIEYRYYLIDFYDFSFWNILYEQDALGTAKSYELYGVSEGSISWKQGQKLRFAFPHGIVAYNN